MSLLDHYAHRAAIRARRLRAIGFRRPLGTVDYKAFERFMAEFHQAFPQATADQYVRAKHVAAAAAGVLIGYGEK